VPGKAEEPLASTHLEVLGDKELKAEKALEAKLLPQLFGFDHKSGKTGR
jgi:hypothetical protein